MKGLFLQEFIILVTDGEDVAEKRRVWREEGMEDMMVPSWTSNPPVKKKGLKTNSYMILEHNLSPTQPRRVTQRLTELVPTFASSGGTSVTTEEDSISSSTSLVSSMRAAFLGSDLKR